MFLSLNTLSYGKKNKTESWTEEGCGTRYLKKTKPVMRQSPSSKTIFLILTVSAALIISTIVGNTLIGMAVYKTKTFRTLVNYILIRFSVVAFLFVEVLAEYQGMEPEG